MPDWFLDWSGEICIIVASGPSATDEKLDDYKDRAKFIAINNSWKLCPWADVLLAADGGWWFKNDWVPEFTGLKVVIDQAQSIAKERGLKSLTLIKRDTTLSTANPGKVGMGGNSGFYAINLAIQFGCKRIILVGYDMTIERGLHWHGKHQKGLNNPVQVRIDRWRILLDKESERLRKAGISIVNASMKSALKAYPKMPINQALQSWSN